MRLTGRGAEPFPGWEIFMKKKVAVLGLGRFGKSLARSLYDAGAEVMVVDRDPSILDSMNDTFSYGITADLSAEEAIRGLGLEEMDIVVVAMASDLAASVMSVMLAKELGVPLVMAKAYDDRMGKILTRIGADRIIFPEEETGIRTARKLLSENFLEFFEIDDDLCLLEMKPKTEWVGKTLIELNLREKYQMNVVAIRNPEDLGHTLVNPKVPIAADSEMLVILERKALDRL